MKVILVNSVTKKVTEAEIDNDLASLQKAIGGGYIETAHNFENGDVCFVDEEGLQKNPETFFTIEGAHQPFAGSGIIVSDDGDGNTIGCKSSLNDIKKAITFIDKTGALSWEGAK